MSVPARQPQQESPLFATPRGSVGAVGAIAAMLGMQDAGEAHTAGADLLPQAQEEVEILAQGVARAPRVEAGAQCRLKAHREAAAEQGPGRPIARPGQQAARIV